MTADTWQCGSINQSELCSRSTYSCFQCEMVVPKSCKIQVGLAGQAAE